MRQITSWRSYLLSVLVVTVLISLTSCGTGGASSGIKPATQSATIQLSDSTLTFSSETVNTVSSPQTVTLTNTGTDTISISSITTSGDFSQANNCGSSLPPNTSCSASVTFTPTGDGTRTGSLTIGDNARGGPHRIGLSGIGSAAAATFTPSSLTFATQQQNTTSAAQTVTLQNTGNTAMSISSIKISGAFAQTNNCGSSLAINASCTINVTFTPTAAGAMTGNLSVADNAAGSPQQISLAGTGAGTPAVSLSSSNLSFGSQQLNLASTAQTVTLTNTGGASLSLTSITTSGDFSQTNTCGSSLGASGSCTVSVVFDPTATGTRTGTLSIADNATGSPQQVTLTGTGAVSAPAVSLSASSLSFASQQLNVTSAAQAVTVKNTGTASLSLTSITISGDFSQTNTCGSSLAANASCTVSVAFDPTAAGTRTGTLSIADNASGSPQQVSLTGSGVGTPVVSLSSSSLTFGNQQLNVRSVQQSVTVTNTGNASLSLTSIAASGDFAETNNCGTSLAAGTACTVNVTFYPTATGTRTGALSIADNATGTPQQVALTGTGVAAVPAVSLSATSLNFGSQPLNVTSTAQAVTVKNTGTASLSLTSITTSGDFSQTNTCGSSLAANASCTVSVAFDPTVTGTRTGTLSIADNASGSPQQVSLTGSGVGTPVVSLSSSSLTFGNQQLNVASTAQAVTVKNTGTASLSLTSITTSGDFSQTNTCGSTLAASASCTVNVAFDPTAAGTRTGTLSIADNASGTPQSVGLSGTGVLAGALAATPNSLAFGTVNVGQSSTLPLTIANSGGSTVTVSTVGTTGSGLSVSGVTVPFNIGAGQSASMNVTFAPTSASTVSGSVYLTNNSPNTNLSVPVTGTGAAVQHQVTVQWDAPSTPVAGYYAYRSTVSGGPYTRISSLDTTTSYIDQAVTGGDTYYYVVTSVDSNNVESAYSNEASATVPLP